MTYGIVRSNHKGERQNNTCEILRLLKTGQEESLRTLYDIKQYVKRLMDQFKVGTIVKDTWNELRASFLVPQQQNYVNYRCIQFI